MLWIESSMLKNHVYSVYVLHSCGYHVGQYLAWCSKMCTHENVLEVSIVVWKPKLLLQEFLY